MQNGGAHLHVVGLLLLDRDLLLGFRIRIGAVDTGAVASALPAAGGAGGGEGGGGLGGGGLGGGDEGGGRRRRCQLARLGIVEWLEVMVG